MADTRLISFVAAGHNFAVPMSAVREVVRVDFVEKLPGSRPPLEGLAVYRGNQVLPVFSLPQAMGGSSNGSGDFILVVEINDQILGFRIARIGSVTESPPEDEIEEYTGDLTRLPGAIEGTWASERGTLLLLELKRVFADYIV